jgi:hypothetical protein
MCTSMSGVPGRSVPSRNSYRLRVEGWLNERAFDDADDLTLAAEIALSGKVVTTLICKLANEDALVRLINLLHRLGLGLLVVERLDLPHPTPG